MLVGGVVAIVALVTSAYFVLSPESASEAAQTLSENTQNETAGENSDVTTTEAIDEIGTPAEPAKAAPTPVPQTTETKAVTPTPAVTAPAPKATGFTAAEVALHNDRTSCWTSVNGKVYDVTAFIERHPGGEERILKLCGKDGTAMFEGQHEGDEKPEARLETLRIGNLI